MRHARHMHLLFETPQSMDWDGIFESENEQGCLHDALATMP